jgi:D-alanine-D-alanine ligase
MQKLRVGVLMGGKSQEREVSFNSGRTVCDHLDALRYDIIPIFQDYRGALWVLPWSFLHRGKISDFEHRLETEAQKITWDSLKNTIDFAYIAQHGRYAEDGTLQGFLEILNIPYLGSKVYASSLRQDKYQHKKILRMHGIDVARDIAISPQEVSSLTLSDLIARMNVAGIEFPCIVKPHKEGSSLGVSCVTSPEQFLTAVNKACYVEPRGQTVLIEEKLEGMEFTSIILTNYKTGELIPLPITEIVADPEIGFLDYEQKYMPGRVIQYTPARCSAYDLEKINNVCLATMKALEFTTMARIDGFLTLDGRVVIIDPNTLSGAAPSSFLFKQAAEYGMGHTELINHLIETELQAYGMLDGVVMNSKNIEENEKKIRVAVLMGGRSNEKEISLESGRNVVYKLSPQKYQAIPLFVNHALELYKLDQRLLVSGSTREVEDKVTDSLKVSWHDLPAIADFVFIALHGGEGENGSVQGTLEMLGMPYNGSSVYTSALCMDKWKTNSLLKSLGFNVPHGLLVTKSEWQNNVEKMCSTILSSLSFPVIVKPHDDGCSVFVAKATDKNSLCQAIDAIFATQKTHALIEEFVQGMELTVGVLGNDFPRALSPSYAVATGSVLSIQEKFLPGAGENQTPAPLPTEALTFIQRTIEKIYQAVNCRGYARIDCFYQSAQQSKRGSERLVVLEINTLPGLTPATCIFHQAAEIGMKPMDFIDAIIELGFQEHTKVGVSQGVIQPLAV